MSRIVVLFANRENRALLAQVLIPQYEVTLDLPAATESDEDGIDVDLIIADGSSLTANATRIAAERQRSEPVVVPVLLLSDRRSVAVMPKDMWRIVDDVVLRPLEKAEMRARVESLIRARRLSQKLKSVSHAYRHERRVAQRFQKAALPRTLPRVPGMAFGAFYRPGTDEAQVGGDWYDALQLPDGRVMVSIGDVCGSGLDAAVAMASVRQVFRGAAHINPDPVTLLDAAHRTLHSENPESLVTAFVGVFDPVTSLLIYASAGHPRPLLRAAGGDIIELQSTGGPLGLPFDVERSSNTVEMPVGSLLVLYTDGLTEATRDPLAGEAALRSALTSRSVLEAPNVALAINDAVLADAARDDVAVLTVAHVARDVAKERLVHWSFDARDADAARDVRSEFVGELKRFDLNENGLSGAELVFAELLGNVVRYAPKWVDVTLDCSGASPVLHVLDSGPGFRHLPKLPENALSEHGRGLFIVSRLTEEFHVTRRPHGGSHARAVLPRPKINAR
jgi:serine phosphatase RsbU (regulator of sigma subunit)/anti-sigma regulatory factor (Ser/Thr protein kinase)